MRVVLITVIAMFFSAFAKAQNVSDLPVVAFPVKNFDPQKGFVLYLSGDGGENAFSKSFIQQLGNDGYSTVFFNSFKYFWTKRSPEQAASDVEKVIRYYRTQWKVQKVIVIGYSFGADVTPFVLTRVSREILASVKNIVLMSPSPTTDFEVHVTELFGKKKNTGSSVSAEINKLPQKPLLILKGEEESDNMDPATLKVPYKLINLKGGHRYDSNTPELATTIVKNL